MRVTSHLLVRQSLKFGLVGLANTAIDFMIFGLLYFWWGWDYLFANAIAYSCGILNSFILNKRWTFTETSQRGHTPKQFVVFVFLNILGLGISTLVLAMMAKSLPVLLAKLFAMGATFVWNFFSSRRFVYL